jgi:magnesium-transporting ATPase (P-type)
MSSLQRHHFASQLKRMSTVVEIVEPSSAKRYCGHVRGDDVDACACVRRSTGAAAQGKFVALVKVHCRCVTPVLRARMIVPCGHGLHVCFQGAPETVGAMLKSKPAGYDAAVQHHTLQVHARARASGMLMCCARTGSSCARVGLSRARHQ